MEVLQAGQLVDMHARAVLIGSSKWLHTVSGAAPLTSALLAGAAQGLWLGA